jgi:SAM-dependent methyltransferase
MKIEELRQTYDRDYAESYDQTFLIDANSQAKTAAELEILRKILGEKGNNVRWLDVACGTGHILSCFPELPNRAGFDISPAMLDMAKRKNPGIALTLGDFRDPALFGKRRWDVISSMWWAYSYADSMGEIEQLVENISEGLSDDGVCFMPICDASTNLCLGTVKIPYVAFEDAPTYGGRILLTGVTWSWIQPNGKRHEHMLVPQVEQMVEMFEKRFQSVEVIEYIQYSFRGIIARKQKSAAHAQ